MLVFSLFYFFWTIYLLSLYTIKDSVTKPFLTLFKSFALAIQFLNWLMLATRTPGQVLEIGWTAGHKIVLNHTLHYGASLALIAGPGFLSLLTITLKVANLSQPFFLVCKKEKLNRVFSLFQIPIKSREMVSCRGCRFFFKIHLRWGR